MLAREPLVLSGGGSLPQIATGAGGYAQTVTPADAQWLAVAPSKLPSQHVSYLNYALDPQLAATSGRDDGTIKVPRFLNGKEKPQASFQLNYGDQFAVYEPPGEPAHPMVVADASDPYPPSAAAPAVSDAGCDHRRVSVKFLPLGCGAGAFGWVGNCEVDEALRARHRPERGRAHARRRLRFICAAGLPSRRQSVPGTRRDIGWLVHGHLATIRQECPHRHDGLDAAR